MDYSPEQLILAASKQQLTPLSGCGILKVEVAVGLFSVCSLSALSISNCQASRSVLVFSC